MKRAKESYSGNLKLKILTVITILLLILVIFLLSNIFKTRQMIKTQTIQTLALQKMLDDRPKETTIEGALTEIITIGSSKEETEEKKITFGDKEIVIPKVKVAKVNDSEDIQNKVGDSSTSSASAPVVTAEETIEKFEDKETSIGIDVSKWQGYIDWNKVKKAGIEFVMIRVGYRGSTAGSIVMDPYFTQNINGAISNGIYVGIYFFSMAKDEEEAIQEAAWTVEAIRKYKITFPVAYDFESFGKDRVSDVSKEQMNKNALAFLNYIKSSGYTGTMYGSKYALETRWNMGLFSSFQVWLAHYAEKTNYKGRYNMWQYTEKGSVDGIKGNVDMDIAYIKYPKLDAPAEDQNDNTYYDPAEAEATPYSTKD